MADEKIEKQILQYKSKVPETGEDIGKECMNIRSCYWKEEETY
jgi:hypothetical protein